MYIVIIRGIMNRLEALYAHYMVVVGSVGHFLFVLQTIKIIQTGSSQDVSLGGFVISFVSLVSWLMYGFMKKDRVLIIVNMFGAIAAFICISTILLFK
jgi:uncharacterized protein with PQ loop repeat